jgi:hypothetical protein
LIIIEGERPALRNHHHDTGLIRHGTVLEPASTIKQRRMRLPAVARSCASLAAVLVPAKQSARCPSPVCAFEPELAFRPALGCFVSLAPVVLSLHWGMELNAAQDDLDLAKLHEEITYLACIKGEICPVAYEERKAETLAAKRRLQKARTLQLSGATRVLLAEYLPVLRTTVPHVQHRRTRATARLAGRVVRRALVTTMTESSKAAAGNAEGAGLPTMKASSLEEKMASWEASNGERRASSLGALPLVGMPAGPPGRITRTAGQPTKIDGFDVGMKLSGLILLPLAILLCTAPFWIGDVGPPPLQ